MEVGSANGRAPVAYFAFGANMSTATLERRGIRFEAAEAGRLPDHELVFDCPGLRWVEPGFASVRPCPGSTVLGVLYWLDRKDFDRLGRFEGSDYVVSRVIVHTVQRGPVEAYIYKTADPKDGLLPSRRYVRVLCSGAREHGLSDDYVEALADRPSYYVPCLSELGTLAFGLADRVQSLLRSPADSRRPLR